MDDSIYEPAEDSEILKRHIKDYSFKTSLDMGCGSGIITKELSKYGTATGADKNPIALEYCRKNNPEITFIETDLFSNITNTYDLITFNAPYLPQDEGIDDIALYGGREGYEIIEQFLNQVKPHLNKNGTILMIYTSASKPKIIEKIMDNNNFEYKQITKEHYFFEDIFLMEIKIKT